MMKPLRDLYQDGIWDVYSINDLDSLKENGQMNVLAKADDYLMIEAGKDFWKIDFKNGEVTQYKDFISLEKDLDGKVVYNKNNPFLNKDYGAVLYDTIQATDIKDLPTFSLQQRQDYFEGTTKGVVKHFMKGEFERSIEKNRSKTQEATNSLFEPIKSQDTKILFDAMQTTLDSLAIFYTFFNQKYKQHKKEQLIKDILNKLDNNELDIREVMSDKILNHNVPELKIILDQWLRSVKRMNVETSTTVDEVLEKQTQQSEMSIPVPLLALPPKKEDIKLLVEHFVDNPKINEIAQELSQQERFHQLRAEQFCKNIDIGMEYEFGENYKENIRKLFDKSEETDSINFAFKQVSSDEIVEEIKMKYPNVSAKECGLAMAYLNHIIENGNNASKELVVEKLTENSINETQGLKSSFNIVFDILQKVIQKVELTMKQEHHKNINIS